VVEARYFTEAPRRWRALEAGDFHAPGDRHPFDDGEDRRQLAKTRKSYAAGPRLGEIGLPERSMREAKVTLAKWRHAAAPRRPH